MRRRNASAMTRLTRKGTGQNDRWGGYIPATSYDRIYTHVVGDGGHMVDPKDITKARFGEPAALGAFEWVRSLMWDRNVLIQRGQYCSALRVAQHDYKRRAKTRRCKLDAADL